MSGLSYNPADYEEPVLILRHKNVELAFCLKEDMNDEAILACVKALRLNVQEAVKNAGWYNFREIKQSLPQFKDEIGC